MFKYICFTIYCVDKSRRPFRTNSINVSLSLEPLISPSSYPTQDPSQDPSQDPTQDPIQVPTLDPTVQELLGSSISVSPSSISTYDSSQTTIVHGFNGVGTFQGLLGPTSDPSISPSL